MEMRWTRIYNALTNRILPQSDRLKPQMPDLTPPTVGKNSSRPHLGPFEAIFPWAKNMQKHIQFCLFPLVGQWALFTRFGEMVAIFLLPSVVCTNMSCAENILSKLLQCTFRWRADNYMRMAEEILQPFPQTG